MFKMYEIAKYNNVITFISVNRNFEPPNALYNKLLEVWDSIYPTYTS